MDDKDVGDGIEVIDGSHGEGGGQVIRTSLSLSVLTGTPVRIDDIRANRPKPGLRPQHLEGIRALSRICNAEVEGLTVGSRQVTFRPGTIEGGRQTIDIGTAGSISLVLQTVLLPSLWAPKETFFRIFGGTDVRWSPSIDYTHFVLLSMLKLMGAEVNLGLIERGYYPRGGGEVEVRIRPLGPDGIRPLLLTRQVGEPSIFGMVHTSGLPDHVGNRLASTARKNLVGFRSVKIRHSQWKANSSGAGITLVAEFKDHLLGVSALGEKGKRAEKVAQEAVDEMMAEGRAGSTMDIHLADQLVPFLALARGPSEFLVREITGHTRTNMWVVERFLGTRFDIEEVEEEGHFRVRISPGRTIDPPRTE